ncbi:MAG: AraC family transcriptional regulator [Prevotella sp.]|nr:AraC family transcriptional regulator [Prevotella sp.]
MQRLCSTTTLSARKCAFNDYSNFVRAFKNIMGIPPTEYRRRYTQ